MAEFKRDSFSNVSWWKRIFSIDRFILWVGQTNSFGQNWFKPAILAIVFTVVFYTMFIVGLSERLSFTINLSPESVLVTIDEFIKHSYALPQLLNPAHNLKKVFSDYSQIGFIVHFWDSILRIVLAFFIFQIVSAFRKYMK